MSMLGIFGICPKGRYNALADLVQNGDPGEAENLVREIYSELENSAEKLENGTCSGEIFLALFHYFETMLGMDVRSGTERLGELWRETTGDFDVVVFCEKDALLSVADAVDHDALSQFASDFFQIDCGNAPQAACDALLNNLKGLGTDEVLIWHLC